MFTRNLTATVYFLLSLFGCDGGGTTLITRASVDGEDALYSKASLRAGIARFECISSASGRCYYTLLPRACTPARVAKGSAADKCSAQPIEHFAMAAGDSREIVGLPAQFDVCVSQGGEPQTTGCMRPPAAQAQSR